MIYEMSIYCRLRRKVRYLVRENKLAFGIRCRESDFDFNGNRKELLAFVGRITRSKK